MHCIAKEKDETDKVYMRGILIDRTDETYYQKLEKERKMNGKIMVSIEKKYLLWARRMTVKWTSHDRSPELQDI